MELLILLSFPGNGAAVVGSTYLYSPASFLPTLGIRNDGGFVSKWNLVELDKTAESTQWTPFCNSLFRASNLKVDDDDGRSIMSKHRNLFVPITCPRNRCRLLIRGPSSLSLSRLHSMRSKVNMLLLISCLDLPSVGFPFHLFMSERVRTPCCACVVPCLC